MSEQGSLSEVHETVNTGSKKGFKKMLAFIGPAYLISVGYMDPGNWAADIAAGSTFGYRLLWVLLLSNLMALLMQGLSARLGIAGKKDLAQASRILYPGWVNIALFALAQIAIIACDLAEVIGMAIGLKLLFNIPLMWGVAITLLDTFLLMFLLRRGIQAMERFIVSMVFIIGLSFLMELLISRPEMAEVAAGLIPTKLDNGPMLFIAITIIGATVMPHNLYLHSSLVQTRKIENTDAGIKQALKLNKIDTVIALNLAFFVNAAILILAASTFYKRDIFAVADIEEAHTLLTSIFGKLSPALFAIALVAAGQSSTVTGTLAGQIIMEGHINLRMPPWLRRLFTRLLAIIPAAVAIYLGGDSGLNYLLLLSQVVLSLQLGFAVIPLIHYTSSTTLMNGYPVPRVWQTVAWLVACVIIGLNGKLVYNEVHQFIIGTGGSLILKITGIIASLTALCLLIYITFLPIIRTRRNTAYKNE